MPDGYRFVLTGGPAVGKTSLANHLAGMGYPVVRESARDVIEEQQALGSKLVPWRDRPAFQMRVLEIQLEREGLASGEVIFCDRGIPDGIAYLRLDDYDDLPELIHHGAGRYNGVFLIEPLDQYVPDNIRFEDVKTAQRVHELINEVYVELGYQPVKVPVLPLAERAEWLLERVNEFTRI